MFGIKTRKPKQFNYAPRYWDPEQEARIARRKAVLGDDYQEGDYRPGSLIRDGRIRRTQTANRLQKKSKSTLIRSVIFVLLVFAVLYMMTSYFELL